MRNYALPCAVLLSLASSAALAQTSLQPTSLAPPNMPANNVPPPPAAQPAPMQPAPMAQQTPMAQPTMAPAPTPVGPQGVPPGANPVTGARPGNDIGTGMSMPMGSTASNINPTDTQSSIAPNLPSPQIGEGASAQAYLTAARNALAAGQTGEAQQSLEMAETRLLDRSTPLFQTNTPSANPVVSQISQALQALAAGDRSQCMTLIEAAIPNAAAAEQAAN